MPFDPSTAMSADDIAIDRLRFDPDSAEPHEAKPHEEMKATSWGPPSAWQRFKRETPYAGSIANALEGEARGAVDPLVGIAQIVHKTLGDRAEQVVRSTPLAPLAPLAGAMNLAGSDEVVKAREEAIKRDRAQSGDTGTDWWRTAGNVMAPTNYLAPGGAGGNFLARIGKSALMGAGGGASMPVTSGDYATEKAKQAASGAAAGTVLGAAGEAAGAVLRPVTRAVQSGIDAVKRWLGAEMPSSLQSAAVHRVLETFGRDEAAGGPKLTEVMDVLDTARAAGKPVTLADTGKANVNALAGYLSRQPGEASARANQFLDARDAGAGDRLHGDITKYVSGGDSMRQTAEALAQSRAAAAKPLYDEAMKVGEVSSPRIQQFLADPIVKRGVKKGLEVQRLEALAKGETFNLSDYGIQGAARDGEPIVGRSPNMRLLDSTKRGLDEILERYRDPTSGRMVLDQRGRAIDQVRQAFVAELDRLNPAYKVARASWSGPSQSIDAMQDGRDLLRQSPEQIAAVMKGASANEKEFLKLGLADRLRQMVDETRFAGDESKAILKNKRTMDQIRAALENSPNAQKFIDAVMSERRMFDSAYGIRGNSATARRLAADEAMSADMAAAGHGVGAAKNALSGNFLAAARDMWRVRQALGWRKNQAMNAEVARILFDPSITQDALQSGAGRRLLENFPGPATQNFLSAAGMRRLQQALAAPAGAVVGQQSNIGTNN